MSNERDRLLNISKEIVATYGGNDTRIHHLGKMELPSREAVITVLNRLQEVIFPGYHGESTATETGIRLLVEEKLESVYDILRKQIFRALHHSQHVHEDHCIAGDSNAEEFTLQFLASIPRLRNALSMDVRAAFEGDPAAKCIDEIIFSYPGVYTLMVQRIAHELHKMGVPLIPRIMTEYAHSITGCDIHPGAEIGQSFFIDHASGVVIGETTIIGDRLKLYQGVTLGALSFPKNEQGEIIRGLKRHPTIEDDVVIYAGATILGGDTVIGKGSVIGGNVWLTHSVAPGSRVTLERAQNRVQPPEVEVAK